ncbi:MAG: hypothetical protein PHR77_02790 [Kiritimatiellae bacterium]|nr:hypothetical protein [Kiritimatiellia bacterium]
MTDIQIDKTEHRQKQWQNLWAILLILILSLMTFSRLFNPDWSVDGGDMPSYIAHQFKAMIKEKVCSSLWPEVGLGSLGPILLAIGIYWYTGFSRKEKLMK